MNKEILKKINTPEVRTALILTLKIVKKIA